VRALITTTINIPTNLASWRRSGFADEDLFIVAGDLKTPHDDVRAFLKKLPGRNIYMSPDEQKQYACSDVIGWNSIQRRNIALLRAMEEKPDWIITVDDDNYPIEAGQVKAIDACFKQREHEVVMHPSGWFNIGQMLRPAVTHRGYPISAPINNDDKALFFKSVRDIGVSVRDIGVVASLWLGDPDISAVQRIAQDPLVKDYPYVNNHVLEIGTWCPFNSQATAFRFELAPLMAVWPFVGRYDDIWASYLARAVMDSVHLHVSYGHPLVIQRRNPHNLLRDLEAEMFGMQYTEALCDILRREGPLNTVEAFELVQRIDFLPEKLKTFFHVWVEDVDKIAPEIL
jgi:hypothetical protein